MIEKLIKTAKGKITKLDDWGKIDLAYEIKGEGGGNFLHFTLELDSLTAKLIGEKLKLEEGIIRYLLVRANPPSRKATRLDSAKRAAR